MIDQKNRQNGYYTQQNSNQKFLQQNNIRIENNDIDTNINKSNTSSLDNINKSDKYQNEQNENSYWGSNYQNEDNQQTIQKNPYFQQVLLNQSLDENFTKNMINDFSENKNKQIEQKLSKLKNSIAERKNQVQQLVSSHTRNSSLNQKHPKNGSFVLQNNKNHSNLQNQQQSDKNQKFLNNKAKNQLQLENLQENQQFQNSDDINPLITPVNKNLGSSNNNNVLNSQKINNQIQTNQKYNQNSNQQQQKKTQQQYVQDGQNFNHLINENQQSMENPLVTQHDNSVCNYKSYQQLQPSNLINQAYQQQQQQQWQQQKQYINQNQESQFYEDKQTNLKRQRQNNLNQFLNEVNSEAPNTYSTELLSTERIFLEQNVGQNRDYQKIKKNNFLQYQQQQQQELRSSKQSLRSNYQKIFIPVIIETGLKGQVYSSANLQQGEFIVDMYQIEKLVNEKENHKIYEGICLLNENVNDQVIIKVYNESREGLNLGLQEVVNYLHIYEQDINFHESGITRMRDFFYYRLCLTDFENAAIRDEFLDYSNAQYQFSQQNLQYASPEVILGLERDEKTDIWSLGCILYELLTTTKLFQSQDQKEIIYMAKKILDTSIKSDKFSKNINDISCQSQLHNDEEEQLYQFTEQKVNKSMQKISRNQQMQNINQCILEVKQNLQLLEESPQLYDFLLGLLQIDPEKRLSVQEALQHPWVCQNTQKQ
ncbi:Protein kinase-like domain [Pseudocohnilembus persalinus]|uniref:Protein kinase-like domain n=1 Tax=Pseudocohnilembus persalinus TaxID=266149 RepID=A0A0V0QP36_PSEPJ|nr:Protein kinase-like domain [Pseudocohnilembus persalinus]|eukprot:KRX03932.1 Protein kinase-like domain [Pseudocohnilembus persalinus]